MLVRMILLLGLALLLFAGGAAGLQMLDAHKIDPVTWLRGAVASSPPAEGGPASAPALVPGKAVAPAPPVPLTEQNWLISPGGGLVDRALVAAYLRQDRLVETRIARLTRRAPLADLLEPGEKLPAPVYRQAFADIRAQALADRDCAALLAAFATRCEMVSATVVDESLDAAGETAEFQIVLAYTQALDPATMPDLATVVLREDRLTLDAPAAPANAGDDSRLLAGFLQGARDECRPDSAARPQCRILSFDVTRDEEGQTKARFHMAWLGPLPAGLYAAPPLN